MLTCGVNHDYIGPNVKIIICQIVSIICCCKIVKYNLVKVLFKKIILDRHFKSLKEKHFYVI